MCESVNGGGGGYGDARRRDPQLVLAEVRDGLLSREAAERDYGVALTADGRTVDVHATARLRGGRVSYRVGIDVGGTFTDFLARRRGRAARPQDEQHARRPLARRRDRPGGARRAART